MGLLANIKNFFVGDEAYGEEPPALGMEALPLAINPTPNVSLERALGRLLNLYRVKHKTQDTLDAIEAYSLNIEALGHTPPGDEAETLALIEKLKEEN